MEFSEQKHDLFGRRRGPRIAIENIVTGRPLKRHLGAPLRHEDPGSDTSRTSSTQYPVNNAMMRMESLECRPP